MKEAKERLHPDPAFPLSQDRAPLYPQSFISSNMLFLEYAVAVIPHHILWNIKGLAHFWGKARNTARPGRAGNYRSNTRAS
jgi:hypothetical protein